MASGWRVFRAAKPARLATYVLALWKLARHRDTPRGARLVAFAVLAYVVSPIDLIPDFIPILGQLDDIILVPLGLALAVRMTPPPLWDACLREAEVSADRVPRFWWSAAMIVAVWMLVLGGMVWLLVRLFR